MERLDLRARLALSAAWTGPAALTAPGLALLSIAFLLPPGLVFDFHLRFSAPLLITLWLAVGWSLIRLWRQSPPRLSPHWPIWLLACLPLWLQPGGYRMVMDELLVTNTAATINLYGVAGFQRLAIEQESGTPEVSIGIDKRPAAVSAAQAIAKAFAPPGPAPAWLLQKIFGSILILASAHIAARLGGVWAGTAMAFFAGLHPLVLYFGSGSGLEVPATALFLLSALVLTGSSASSRAALLSAGLLLLLLAQIRYESLLLALPGAVLLGIRLRLRRAALAGVLASPFLLPLAASLAAFRHNPASWELASRSADAAFGLSYLPGNLAGLIEFWLVPSPALANSPVLGWASAIGLSLAAATACRPAFEARRLTVLVLAGTAAYLLLVLLYFWGDLRDPIIQRLALPLVGAAALGVGHLFRHFRTETGRSLAAAAALLLLTPGFPGLIERNFARIHLSPEEINALRFVVPLLREERALVLAEAPYPWITEGLEAAPIATTTAPAFHQAILARASDPGRGSVYVLQRVNANGEPVSPAQIPQISLPMRQFLSISVGPDNHIRLLRVLAPTVAPQPQ